MVCLCFYFVLNSVQTAKNWMLAMLHATFVLYADERNEEWLNTAIQIIGHSWSLQLTFARSQRPVTIVDRTGTHFPLSSPLLWSCISDMYPFVVRYTHQTRFNMVRHCVSHAFTLLFPFQFFPHTSCRKPFSLDRNQFIKNKKTVLYTAFVAIDFIFFLNSFRFAIEFRICTRFTYVVQTIFWSRIRSISWLQD